MSNCQSLVKPDCSKQKVNKSQGVLKAINHHLLNLCGSRSSPILCNIDRYPAPLVDSVGLVTIEFAGVKFGSDLPTGAHYLNRVKEKLLQPVLHHLKNVEHVVISEEKYKFTPDDFKAATCKQRQQQDSTSIAHLKIGEDIF